MEYRRYLKVIHRVARSASRMPGFEVRRTKKPGRLGGHPGLECGVVETVKKI